MTLATGGIFKNFFLRHSRYWINKLVCSLLRTLSSFVYYAYLISEHMKDALLG